MRDWQAKWTRDRRDRARAVARAGARAVGRFYDLRAAARRHWPFRIKRLAAADDNP